MLTLPARRGATCLAAALVVVSSLAACAPARPLAPVAPDRATHALAEARADFAARPSSPESRLMLGKALYDAGQDKEAESTLISLLATGDPIGGTANLYFAAAADRLGEVEVARHGYQAYLLAHESDDVRARLGEVERKSAQVAVRGAIASERTLAADRYPPGAIGVTPFVVLGRDSSIAALGYGLADLLLTDLSRSSKLQVVDRVRIDELVRETRIGNDSSTEARTGLLIGARRLVSGSVTSLSDARVGIDTRVFDVVTARRVGNGVRTTTSLDDLLDQVETIAFRLFDELGVTLTPAERALVEKKPTRSLAAFLAFGRGVRDEAIFDFGGAGRSYAEALALDPDFALARAHLASISMQSGVIAAPTRSLGMSGLVDGVNPSPAGDLGAFADRGNRSARAAFEGSAFGNIFIVVFTPAHP
ncbi:MAG: CsgG/HfaB family protein [Gemmatimonadota bacterium]|nr:CsgG/HfaB family protein [Gemmatimonadota bacterium]